MRRLLAVRDARVYLTGQVFSLFGDTALWLARGIWVKTLTGSNAAAGLVFFVANVPVLLTPLTGLLVDRVRRRPLLIAVNALTGAAVLGGGHVVAILDAATFVVPVVSLLMLRVREPSPQPRQSHRRAELTAGKRHVVRTPALRHLVMGNGSWPEPQRPSISG